MTQPLQKLKKYIRDELHVDDEQEQVYFDNFNPSDLENVIERQNKIISYMKSKKIKKLHSILIVIDDHADDPKFVRYSKFLHGLFTRGRHDAVSVICSTQKYNVLAPIIRLNASSLYIFRLKHASELMSFIEENSAIDDKQQLLDMYHQAVNFAPYSSFYVNMNSKDINKMFHINFEQAFQITNDE